MCLKCCTELLHRIVAQNCAEADILYLTLTFEFVVASFVLSALFLQQLLNWKIRKFRNLEQHFERIILLVDAFDSDRINGLGKK